MGMAGTGVTTGVSLKSRIWTSSEAKNTWGFFNMLDELGGFYFERVSLALRRFGFLAKAGSGAMRLYIRSALLCHQIRNSCTSQKILGIFKNCIKHVVRML